MQQKPTNDKPTESGKEAFLYGIAFFLCVLTTLLMLLLSGNALQIDAVYRGF